MGGFSRDQMTALAPTAVAGFKSDQVAALDPTAMAGFKRPGRSNGCNRHGWF